MRVLILLLLLSGCASDGQRITLCDNWGGVKWVYTGPDYRTTICKDGTEFVQPYGYKK